MAPVSHLPRPDVLSWGERGGKRPLHATTSGGKKLQIRRAQPCFLHLTLSDRPFPVPQRAICGMYSKLCVFAVMR